MPTKGVQARTGARRPSLVGLLLLLVVVVVLIAIAGWCVFYLVQPTLSTSSVLLYFGPGAAAAVALFAGLAVVADQYKWLFAYPAFLFSGSACAGLIGSLGPQPYGYLFWVRWGLSLLVVGIALLPISGAWLLYASGMLGPGAKRSKEDAAIRRRHLVVVGFFPSWAPSRKTAIRVGEYIECEISIVNSGPTTKMNAPKLDGFPHLGLTFARDPMTSYLSDLANGEELDPAQPIHVDRGGARLLLLRHQAIKATHGILIWYRVAGGPSGSAYSSPGFPLIVNPDAQGRTRLTPPGQ